jgi:hypothetical protein
MGLEVAKALYNTVHDTAFKGDHDEVVYLDFFEPATARSLATKVEAQAEAYHDGDPVDDDEKKKEKLRLTTQADLILAWALVEKLAHKRLGDKSAPEADITFADALGRHIPIYTADNHAVSNPLVVIHLDEAQCSPHLAPFLVRAVVAHNSVSDQKVLLLLSGTWISDVAWERLIGVSPVQQAVKVVDLGFVQDRARQIVANAALGCNGFGIDVLTEQTVLNMLIEDTRGWAQACVQLGSQLKNPRHREFDWLSTVEQSYYSLIEGKYQLAAKDVTSDLAAMAKSENVTLLHSNLMTQKLGAFALCPYQINIAEIINGGTLESCLKQGLYRLEMETGRSLARLQMARSMVAVLANLKPKEPIHPPLFAPRNLLPHNCLYTLHDTHATCFEQIQLYSLINAIEAVHAMDHKDHLAESSLRPDALLGLGAELPISLATGPVYVLEANCFPAQKVIGDALEALSECLREEYRTVILAAFTPIGTQGIDSWIRFADGTYLYLQSKGAMMETEKTLQAKRALKQGEPAPGYEISFGPAELDACLTRIDDVLRKHNLPKGLYEVATIKRAPSLCKSRDIPPGCVFICNRKDIPCVDALEPVFGHIPARMFWRAAEVAELEQSRRVAATAGEAAGKTARLATNKGTSRRPQDDEEADEEDEEDDEEDEAANRRVKEDEDEEPETGKRLPRLRQDDRVETGKRRPRRRQEDEGDEESQAQAAPPKAGRLQRADASVDEYGASAAVEGADGPTAPSAKRRSEQRQENREEKKSKHK